MKSAFPIANMMLPEFADPKQRSLFKNITYLGAMAGLLNIEFRRNHWHGSDSIQGQGRAYRAQYSGFRTWPRLCSGVSAGALAAAGAAQRCGG